MLNRSKVKEEVLEESKRGVEIEGMEAWSNRYLEDKVDPSTGFARERANKRASERCYPVSKRKRGQLQIAGASRDIA